MRILTFLLDPSSVKSMRNNFKQAINSKIPLVENDVIRFNNFDAISGILSPAKMKIFSCILNENPNSLYDLAKIMNKDQSQILREVKVLESLGLVNLVQDITGGKEKIKLVAIYDQLNFVLLRD